MKVVFMEAAVGRHTDRTPRQVHISARRFAPKAVFGWVLATLKEWRHRSRARTELAMLDDRMLRDIGANRAEIWREINKPFWRS